MNRDRKQYTPKNAPVAKNIGPYPRYLTRNPADIIEENSAILMGACSKPMSTEIFLLSLATLRTVCSKKPMPYPRTNASAKRQAMKNVDEPKKTEAAMLITVKIAARAKFKEYFTVR